MYETGVPGVLGKDLAKAEAFYEVAAKQGMVSAKVNLGILLEQGKGTRRDPERAMELWAEASEQRHAKAAFFLGERYFLGKRRNAQGELIGDVETNVIAVRRDRGGREDCGIGR